MRAAYPIVRPKADWQKRHNAALTDPKGVEQAWVLLISALVQDTSVERTRLFTLGTQQYRLQYLLRFESEVGSDYVLGPHLKQVEGTDNQDEVVEGLQGLLNGDTGRLDCGTLWSWLEEQR
jgi:hypothetical protein